MWTSHGHERVWWAPNSWELNWSNASLWWKWTLGKLWDFFFFHILLFYIFFWCLTSGARFVVVVVVAAHSLREHGLGHSLREFNTGSPKRCHPKVQLHFPIILEMENYPKWKDTNIGDIPFSTSMIMGGRVVLQHQFSVSLLIWSCQGSDRQWYFRQLPGSFGHFRRRVKQGPWIAVRTPKVRYIFSSSHLRRLEMDDGDVLPTIFPCRICRSFLLILLLIKVPWNKLILHFKEIMFLVP